MRSSLYIAELNIFQERDCDVILNKIISVKLRIHFKALEMSESLEMEEYLNRYMKYCKKKDIGPLPILKKIIEKAINLGY